ncbi:hypothetical protein NPIL_231461 [Nephila pilipes]|uniref:Uncharacterized protein n=1 Tax=Nephila pilipes TaxID=299642 RepID=A0A8X6TYR3_NEPPI|nr:hypothetical protein NPIL_231461 [Nephila pilipes]
MAGSTRDMDVIGWRTILKYSCQYQTNRLILLKIDNLTDSDKYLSNRRENAAGDFAGVIDGNVDEEIRDAFEYESEEVSEEIVVADVGEVI